jgi:hypothetical protein
MPMPAGFTKVWRLGNFAFLFMVYPWGLSHLLRGVQTGVALKLIKQLNGRTLGRSECCMFTVCRLAAAKTGVDY